MTSGATEAETSAYIGLGSNIGDRRAYLSYAINGLLNDRRLDLREVSGLYETQPVGGPLQGAYLNAVALFWARIDPYELLDLAHQVEEHGGRDRSREERWGARPLDIDLLAVGNRSIATDGLTLPHPRLYEREFVLVPLLDVAGSIDSAIDFERVMEAAGEIRGTQGVELLEGPDWF